MFPSVLGLVLLLNAGQTEAIRDDAGLFDPERKAIAEKKIEELKQQYHRAVVVRTLPQLDEARVKRLQKVFDRNRLFRVFALEEAAEAGVDGLFIFICTDPKHKNVQVVAHPRDQESLFTLDDCDRLRRQLGSQVFSGRPNVGLIETLQQVHEILGRRLTDEGPQPGGSLSWKTIGLALGTLVLVWIVLGLITMQVKPPPENVEGQAPLRPRFLAALLGGMFGSAASGWIHDKLLTNRPPESSADQEAESSETPQEEESGE